MFSKWRNERKTCIGVTLRNKYTTDVSVQKLPRYFALLFFCVKFFFQIFKLTRPHERFTFKKIFFNNLKIPSHDVSLLNYYYMSSVSVYKYIRRLILTCVLFWRKTRDVTDFRAKYKKGEFVLCLFVFIKYNLPQSLDSIKLSVCQ